MRVLLCPLSDRGYLYPAIAVGLELRRRGHDVHVLARSTAAPALTIAGLPHLAAEEYGGASAFNVSHWSEAGPQQYAAVMRAAKELCADALATSVLNMGSLLAAEVLGLPVAVLGFAVHIGEYAVEAEASPVRAWITRELKRHYANARHRVGLASGSHWRAGHASADPLLGTVTLLRGHPDLEEPGAVLPAKVHHIGPCTWEPPIDPGWQAELMTRLDEIGKPVIYVHLGRVFGGDDPWPRLNAVFTGGPWQAVVERGRSGDPAPAPEADIVVVKLPWMGPLVDRAELVLTSGTSAPVLAGLLRGRPLGVSPNGSEQPLLARACVRAGVALRLPSTVTGDPVLPLRTLGSDAGVRRRAVGLGLRLAAMDSERRAAELVEAMVVGPKRLSHNGRSATSSSVVSSTSRRTNDRIKGATA